MNGPSEIGDPKSGTQSSNSDSESGLTETPVIDRIPRMTAGKKLKKRKPPRPTLATPRTQFLLPRTGGGWLKAIGASAGVLAIVVAALFGIRLISETGCAEFTTERTTVTQDGLQINVQPGDLIGSYGVKLASVPLDGFNASAASADAQQAFAAMSPSLSPQSSFVTVRACSVNPRLVTLRMTLPETATALNTYDIYGWRSQDRTWDWLGGEVNPLTREVVARVSAMPDAVMLMQTAKMAPVLAVDAPRADSDPNALADKLPEGAVEVSAGGVYLGDQGGITGDNTPMPRAVARNGALIKLVPAVRNWGVKGEVNRTLLRNLLASPAARESHINRLVNFAQSQGVDRLELDYRGVDASQREAFADLIEALSRQLAEKGKSLVVTVPAPSRADASAAFDLPGYDLARIGRAAALVKLDLSANPESLNGELDDVINWAVGQVNRYKLQAVVPTVGVQQDANGRTALIGLEDALAGLGPLQADPPAARPGSNVRLIWSGGVNAADVRYDPTSKRYSYSYVDERGIQQTVWLGTAASLKQTLQRLSAHNIRGVTLRGMMQPGNDEGVPQVVNGFTRGDLDSVSAPDPAVKVAFGAGTPFTLALNEGVLEVQAPGGEGAYTLQVTFESARPVPMGVSAITVSKDAPMPAGGAISATASALVTDTAGVVAQQVPSAAVMLPGVTVDVFELGGQVNDLTHATQMKSSGMSWAKVDAQGFDIPAAFIADAKAKGLKVLVTAVGDRTRVMDAGYQAEWAAHLGKIAAAGADAIEVWSEPNYEGAWPSGQINGASYAELLKQAYGAIKQANPNTLVISAGLAQTAGQYSGGCDPRGCDEVAYLGQMAAANAQNFMDCVGIHYTLGAGAPNAVGADHYSWYYEPLRNASYGAFNGAKPVCFTAIGYVTAVGFNEGMPANYSFAAGTTLANHAAWLAEAARMSKESGKVRLMIVWNVDATVFRSGDPSTGSGGDPQAGYAIIRPDGTCPACESLRNVMGSQ
jgi:spore germination protein YaaH